MNSVAYCGWQPQTGRTPGAADAPLGVLFVFKAPFRSVYKELHADHETGAADNK